LKMGRIDSRNVGNKIPICAAKNPRRANIYITHYFKGGKFLNRLSLAHDQGKVME